MNIPHLNRFTTSLFSFPIPDSYSQFSIFYQVQIESQVLDPENSSFSMPGIGVVTIPVDPTSPPASSHNIGTLLGNKRSHPDSIP